MPLVTLQLGQCGNQLGCSFFQTLANELSSCDYGRQAVEEFFRPVQGGPLHGGGGGTSGAGRESDKYCARAVLIDMEPKVVHAARATAAASGGWWRYPPRGFLCMQSGSGNNWAHGFHGYGPQVREAAMELVRREAEACDVLSGFVLLQSMAGGTGAGLGTYVAQALRDEFPSSHLVNCCVWPYESGEVIVQSYNTLLTLSHLTDVSDGVVLMSNEALHRLCNKLYNIPRPSFADMNVIAARALANLMLPSSHRPAAGPSAAAAATASSGSSSGSHADPRTPTGRGGGGATAGRPPPGGGGGQQSPLPSRAAVGAASGGGTLRLLPDLVSHLCSHPHFRLLSLRSIPQMPAASADFTTFTWQAMNKRLKQMLITGGVMEEGMDWGVTLDNSPGSRGVIDSGGVNRSIANLLVLRGHAAAEVDVSEFADPALYPRWAVDPLLVASSPQRYNKYMMAAAMLSNDQSAVGPIRRMQERAYGMLASRAFVHQYEKYGLGVEGFRECFAHVEEIAERYAAL